jgi:thiamine pyrophosphate-dependent acetolactate synthase large subunit-like protein
MKYKNIKLAIIILSIDQDFIHHAHAVFSELSCANINIEKATHNLETTTITPIKITNKHPVYLNAQQKSQQFFLQQKNNFKLRLISAASFVDIIDSLNKHQLDLDTKIGPVIIDNGSLSLAKDELARHIQTFSTKLHQLGYTQIQTPFSTINYCASLTQWQQFKYFQQAISKVISSELWIFQTDLLCFFTDFCAKSFTSMWAHYLNSSQQRSNTLGHALFNFFHQRLSSSWLFLSFTGSLVSSLINYLDQKCWQNNIFSLKGPSEHSLACMAQANWQLYGLEYLIVITSGMLDEFKGTLANLCQAKAKGIIVCAEGREALWFPFQGTINQDEDIRKILRAKKIPYVYIQELEELAPKLKQVFTNYQQIQGPLVILASQQVLESKNQITKALHSNRVKHHLSRQNIFVYKEEYQIIKYMLNKEDKNILWHVGNLSHDEREKVYSIAKQAGIALTDSLVHPGAVSKYQDGKINPNYLGTLGLYGFSSKVYNFLHTNDKLNAKDKQTIFFLKSKIDQVSCPFSASTLDKKLHLVQVNHQPAHIAPFTDLPVCLSLNEFLDFILQNLKVDPQIKKNREDFISRLSSDPVSINAQLPVLPMSPNYFFNRLNQTLEALIKNHEYTYTGVYEVGRSGISAIRNLARTSPGFSGWYGRALIGDALQTLPALALTTGQNLLAFIGDGAKALVPDILPAIVQNLLNHKCNIKNISIFYCINSSLSLINSYQEYMKLSFGGRQMDVYQFDHQNLATKIDHLFLKVQTVHSFDNLDFQTALLAPNTINVFNVILGKNSIADGLGLFTQRDWQIDKTTQLDQPSPKELINKKDLTND